MRLDAHRTGSNDPVAPVIRGARGPNGIAGLPYRDDTTRFVGVEIGGELVDRAPGRVAENRRMAERVHLGGWKLQLELDFLAFDHRRTVTSIWPRKRCIGALKRIKVTPV